MGIVLMIAWGYGNASNSLEVMMLRRLALIVQPLISHSVVGHVMLFVATNLHAARLILYRPSGYNDTVAHIGRDRLNVCPFVSILMIHLSDSLQHWCQESDSLQHWCQERGGFIIGIHQSCS